PRAAGRRTWARVAGPPLNAAQAAACAAISAAASTFTPFLLDGVTGSGKTEVYLDAIADVVARGAQALVLVPEIALTPQTVRRFRERLGFEVALLHSGLSEGERGRAWLAAAAGDASVVLGTRSAVFVPMARPGLIVIDEEHDASYKQQDGFRYHARDLAVVRAKALGVPLVLGSATPSLESLANAEAGRYRHLRLVERAGVARPPELHVMDLRHKRVVDGLAIDSLRTISAHLDAGGQVLVFRNRRGYAPVLFCHACGWSAQCGRCDRPLTVHRGAARLRCHHCGAEERVPAACPACASPALGPQGVGTERLEAMLAERFPNVPVVRIDRDSTRTRGGRDALLDGLDAEGARILVGTQMLAKGHDLSGLTLVVVVGVDEGLYSVDFRAGERLGQLIVQVAGRAGRADRPGSVILQTHHPQHPLLAALLEGGYPMLARRLLAERAAASLPPFAHLALLRAEAKQNAQTLEFLAAAAAVARASRLTVLLHGPLPAPMPRRAGFLRSQLLIEAAERPLMQAFLAAWLPAVRALPLARRVRWSIDVDPVEMG
ncbi:MAG: primosomal protein N', partial [Xanthomonadales bacterium]|nr:primosomal protein N' [Xanthomonadales bacterium]